MQAQGAGGAATRPPRTRPRVGLFVDRVAPSIPACALGPLFAQCGLHLHCLCSGRTAWASSKAWRAPDPRPLRRC